MAEPYAATNDYRQIERPWRRLLAGVGAWVRATVLVAVVIGLISFAAEAFDLSWNWFSISPKDDSDTIVQVVSAVVIAIFVFAAGTSFVVAQVVPGTRGSRAVELLRTQHLQLTIAPALALTPLSCLVLPLSGRWTTALASALLVGSVAYLFVATWALLRILGEATSPEAYGRLLEKRYCAALRIQPNTYPPAPAATDDRALHRLATRWGFTERPEAGSGVDYLYETIRALRGWTRTAATTGDSRELHVSLEQTLKLVRMYASTYPPPDGRTALPTNYEHNEKTSETNPLDAERKPEWQAEMSPSDLSPWCDWVPRSLGSTEPGPKTPTVEKMLARVWVANEVGRSLVRAAEFGAASPVLLERDRGRLLNTFAKTARRFADEGDPASVGVMVGYLVELGLGARRSTPDQILWHFEPLAVLVDLHEHFHGTEWRSLTRADRHFQKELRVIQVGIAAGVLKVAEAITAARLRASTEQPGESDPPIERVADKNGNSDGNLGSSQVETPAQRTVRELRGAVEPYWPTWSLKLPDPDDRAEPPLQAGLGELVRRLAKSRYLEPRDQPRMYPPDGNLVDRLHVALCPPQSGAERSS